MTVTMICEWAQPRSLDNALAQVCETHIIGAQYAKWQIFDPARLVTPDAPRYWGAELGGPATQRETFEAGGQLTEDEWREVADACRFRDIEFMATPFDLQAVTLLERLGVGAYKLASGDINYKPLVDRVAQTRKRVFVSTGAASQPEIDRALQWLHKCDVVPMACDLVYPCSAASATVGPQMRRLRDRAVGNYFDIGYSDHTREVVTGAVAVTHGATVLEKHITLDRDGGCPDDRMALTSYDAQLYRRLAVDASILNAKVTGDPQAAARVGARRSAHAARDLPAGHILGVDDVAWLRPAPEGSIAPTQKIAGRTLTNAIDAGARIDRYDLD